MKKRIIFFITLSFFLTSFHLFAQDSQKQVAEIDGVKIKDDEKVSGNIMSPFQIQKLIGGKRYTEKGVIHSGKEYTKALEELYKYIDYYPERFDRAERLIRIILNRRKKYSELFDDLITYSNEHPEDLVGCGERVNDMIALEDNPPEEISRLMDVFRQMYLYKHYDNLLCFSFKKISD